MEGDLGLNGKHISNKDDKSTDGISYLVNNKSSSPDSTRLLQEFPMLKPYQ